MSVINTKNCVLFNIEQHAKPTYSKIPSLKVCASDVELALHSELIGLEQFTWPSLIKDCYQKNYDAAQVFLLENPITVKSAQVPIRKLKTTQLSFVNGFASVALLKALPEEVSKQMLITIHFEEDASPKYSARAYLALLHIMNNPAKEWKGNAYSAPALAALLPMQKYKDLPVRIKRILHNGIKRRAKRVPSKSLMQELYDDE